MAQVLAWPMQDPEFNSQFQKKSIAMKNLWNIFVDPKYITILKIHKVASISIITPSSSRDSGDHRRILHDTIYRNQKFSQFDHNELKDFKTSCLSLNSGLLTCLLVDPGKINNST